MKLFPYSNGFQPLFWEPHPALSSLSTTPWILCVLCKTSFYSQKRNSIKGSKNAYSDLVSKNTASQNIGMWDWMMTSSN